MPDKPQMTADSIINKNLREMLDSGKDKHSDKDEAILKSIAEIDNYIATLLTENDQLREDLKNALKTLKTVDSENESLMQEKAQLKQAADKMRDGLKRFISDFEGDFMINGIVVDEPDKNRWFPIIDIYRCQRDAVTAYDNLTKPVPPFDERKGEGE